MTKHIEELRVMNLPLMEYAIFGSGPMALRGIRENNDLDILVTDKLWNEIIKQHHEIKDDKIVIGNVEVCRSWPPYRNDVSDLISSSEKIMHGDPGLEKYFSYVKLEYVLEWKETSTKKKDKEDVLLIRAYLGRQQAEK